MMPTRCHVGMKISILLLMVLVACQGTSSVPSPVRASSGHTSETATTDPSLPSNEIEVPSSGSPVLWAETWDSGLNEAEEGAFHEEVKDLAIHGRWMYAAGASSAGPGRPFGILLKYEVGTGRLVWEARYPFDDGTTTDRIEAVAVSEDGSQVFITGAENTRFKKGDMFLAALSARSGRVAWTRKVQTGSAWGVDVKATLDGGVVVIGTAWTPSERREIIVSRFSSDGNRIWKQAYGERETQDEAAGLALGENALFVTGVQRHARRDQDQVTVALDLDGKALWDYVWEDPPGYVYGGEVSVVSDRVFVVSTGQVLKQRGATTTAVFAFDSSNGDVVWSDMISANTGYVSGNEVAVSSDGAVVYAVGLPGQDGQDHFEEFLVRAYEAATGAVLWTTNYNPADGTVGVTDIVANQHGVVIGADLVESPRRDLLTISFSRENGEILWTGRHNPSTRKNAETIGGPVIIGPREVVVRGGMILDGHAGTGYARGDAVLVAYP